ncbi:MAG: YHS domain-containing protein [Planctomycetes bacterium]|nr:YHS domain-containing protein [Planctomycetota bacterium]
MTLVRWALAGLLLWAGGCTLPDRRLDAVRDPVCGRIVEKKSATASLTYLRKVYYFDSEECLRTFDAHPARYCDVASALYPEYDY